MKKKKKNMFCPECGFEVSNNQKFCTSCGAKIIKKKYPYENYIPEKSRLNEISNEEGYLKYQSTAKIIILSIITFGLYTLVLFYRWIVAVNKKSDRDLVNPSFATLLTLVTFGLAGIYFEYQIANRLNSIIKDTNGINNPKRETLTPPPESLKEIVLFGNLIAFALGLASGGAAFIISIGISLYILIILQRAVEYMLCVIKLD